MCSSAGPGRSEETLESVPHAVRHADPLGCAAICLLHGLVYHRSARLLQPGMPLGTLKRQRLSRHGFDHYENGEPFRLSATTPLGLIWLDLHGIICGTCTVGGWVSWGRVKRSHCIRCYFIFSVKWYGHLLSIGAPYVTVHTWPCHRGVKYFKAAFLAEKTSWPKYSGYSKWSLHIFLSLFVVFITRRARTVVCMLKLS